MTWGWLKHLVAWAVPKAAEALVKKVTKKKPETPA